MVSFGSNSSSQSSSVWDQQAPYLQSLYAGLMGLGNYQTGGGVQQPMQQQAAQGWSGGGGKAGAIRQLRQGGQPQIPGGFQVPGQSTIPGQPSGPTAQAAGGMQSPWGPYASASAGLSQGLLSGQNPWVSGQIQNLGQDIGNFYNQQILPGINQHSSFYGGTGGSAQGIAQGLAGQSALQQFQQGANDIYAQSLQNAPTLYNLGMAPWQAQWEPYQQLANLIGPPTVLGQGSSRGFNFGLGFTSGGSGGGGATVGGGP